MPYNLLFILRRTFGGTGKTGGTGESASCTGFYIANLLIFFGFYCESFNTVVKWLND